MAKLTFMEIWHAMQLKQYNGLFTLHGILTELISTCGPDLSPHWPT